jgi:hypothetical protein
MTLACPSHGMADEHSGDAAATGRWSHPQARESSALRIWLEAYQNHPLPVAAVVLSDEAPSGLILSDQAQPIGQRLCSRLLCPYREGVRGVSERTEP